MRRRTFLGLAAGAGAAAMAGCAPPPELADPGPRAAPPTFRAVKGLPTPDIVGTKDGLIPNTYFRYPADPPHVVPRPPGDGRPVSMLTQTFAAVPPAVDRNSVWSNLNAEIGSDLQIQLVPNLDYRTKFATVVAGDSLPDLFFIDPEFVRIPELMAARAADLSDHLSGDAILDYPNLANLPPACWDVGRHNGRLYGLPTPRGAIQSGVLFRRDDLLAKRGISGEPSSFDDFYARLQEVNDPKGGVWALTASPLQYIRNMLSIPNFWRYADGTMQSWWTAPEQEQALESARRLFADGLVNPDAYVSPNKKTWFGTGKAYFNDDALVSWSQTIATYGPDTEGYDVGACTIPAYDGNGKGRLWLSFPSFGFSAIAKSAADRVPTLLAIANYLAAPFGSAEFLTVRYGKLGPDYTLEGGDPTPTKTGGPASQLGLKALVDAPQVNFVSGNPDSAKKLDRLLRKLVPDAIPNDAVYLYSKTAADRFAAQKRRLDQLEFEIIQGREPVTTFTDEVRRWWSRYGERMAGELTEAYHAAGRG